MKRFTLLLAFSFSQIILVAQNNLVFTASNETVAVGSTACVKITATNFTNIGSFQLSLTWDKTVVTFLELKNFGLTGLTLGNFNPNADGSGMVLTGVWNSPDGLGKSLSNGTVLFEICFTAIGGSSTAITFTDVPNVREATNEVGNLVPFSQQNGSITISGGGKDCTNLNLNFNDPCNDNNPITTNDKVDTNCQCKGTPICTPGTSCNDNNPLTTNDLYDQNCQCKGTPITTQLTLTCPTNIVVNAVAGQNTAVVNYTAPVGNSNCPTGSVTTTRTSGLASGGAFPIGVSTVTYSASDNCGNTATCSFSVTVNTEPPPPPPPGTCSGNLLSNSDFSNGFSSWWSHQGNLANEAAQICDNAGGCGQSVPGSPGKTYRLSVMATLSTANLNALMTMKFLDSNGNELDVESSQFIYQNSPQPQVLEATAPTGTKFVQIHCWRSKSNGCLTVDDWCLTDNGTPPPPAPSDCAANLLQNANFANGFAMWWSHQSTANPVSGLAEICSPEGGFGQWAGAEVGQTYVLKVKAALGSPDSRASVTLKFLNADGNLLGSEISTLIKNTSPQEYALTGKAPSGSKYVQVVCWKSYGGGCVSARDWCLGKSGTTNLAMLQSLLTFNAYRNGNQVDLKWMNRSAGLNDYFVIERSGDGQNFSPIQKVDAQFLDDRLLYFNELDINPLPGENFYRLKWVLKDGSFSYSEIQKVQMPSPADFSIYPNPANDAVWLKLPAEQTGFSKLRIVNALGQVAREMLLPKNSGGQIWISLEGLTEGFYDFQVLGEGVRTVSLKLVIAR